MFLKIYNALANIILLLHNDLMLDNITVINTKYTQIRITYKVTISTFIINLNMETGTN